MRRAPVILLAACALLAACGAPKPEVTPQLVALAQRRFGTCTTAELERGRAILLTRCNECHSPPGPDEHEERDWRGYLDQMAPKAHLQTAERHDLERYLFVSRDWLAARDR